MFSRTHCRSWVSDAHVWLGKGILLCASSNLVTGMLLYGYRRVYIVVVAIFLAIELLGLSIWVWWVRKRSSIDVRSVDGTPAWASQQVDYFALHEEDETDVESDNPKAEMERSTK